MDSTVRSLGKISARIDTIITSIADVESDKESLSQQKEALERRVQQLELESRNREESFQEMAATNQQCSRIDLNFS